ncbi:hypothetical protein ACOBQX_20675 [Actinokineospora sp. G85]|uniref:hypothetical protein n=1 Tax=Actinokineospora sp. G85 TaxID=3406626 RepID=UPI003C76E656
MLKTFVVWSLWRMLLLAAAVLVPVVLLGVLLGAVFDVNDTVRTIVVVATASVVSDRVVRRGWVWVNQGGLDVVPLLGAKTWVPWDRVVGLDYEPSRSRLPGRLPVLRTVDGDLPLTWLSFTGKPSRRMRRLAEAVRLRTAAA